MARQALPTVLRSEVSLGHLGEAVGRMLALGTDDLSSGPDPSLSQLCEPE